MIEIYENSEENRNVDTGASRVKHLPCGLFFNP